MRYSSPSNEYEYEVRSIEIIPPMGGIYKYAGIVDYIFRIKKDGNNERIGIDFKETHGRTEKEAVDKIKNEIENWMQDN